MGTTDASPSFLTRMSLAFRLLGDSRAAARALSALDEKAAAPAATAPAPEKAQPSPEFQHASGLAMLGMLQREGRLVDFLKEDVAAFSDAEIGAAARVVHAGCRKTLDQYLKLEPALPQADGETVTLPSGYDTQRVQLSGNITGQPPFRGTLRHHGWIATEVKLPTLSKAIDARVIAPAEVEL